MILPRKQLLIIVLKSRIVSIETLNVFQIKYSDISPYFQHVPVKMAGNCSRE